jgi:tetratricopeptide (TPR) repeat protein
VRRARKLGAALKRLDRELKVRRGESDPNSAPVAREPSAPIKPRPQVAPQSAAERSHVKQLLLRRRRQLSAQQESLSVEGQTLKGEGAIPEIRRLFAQQSFAKALVDLKAGLMAEPDSTILKMYALYAELRANASLEPEPLAELKGQLRDHLTHDEHGGFVHLAFGHVMLFLKKEEAAEKYFQKALEMDKSSKDAERHLHLLEVRRKVSAKKEKGNKIFGIEIGASNSTSGPTKVFGIEIGKKK